MRRLLPVVSALATVLALVACTPVGEVIPTETPASHEDVSATAAAGAVESEGFDSQAIAEATYAAGTATAMSDFIAEDMSVAATATTEAMYREIAAGTATAMAPPSSGISTDILSIPAGSPVDLVIVSPIKATFYPEMQSTEYEITPLGTPSIKWSGVPCGDYAPHPNRKRMIWSHPHPPCDPTTGHDHVTITATLQFTTSSGSVREVICAYQGASSGVGDPCRWGDVVS